MELQKGKSQGNTPELTANADLSYTWRFMDMSFGGRYYDNVWANTMNTEKVPSFTTFRASFTMRGQPGTRFEGLSFSVNAENLFDQYFFTSSGGTGAFNGSVTADYGRTLTFAINARY
jgi:outer membrane receptor protein involved in Fe transport